MFSKPYYKGLDIARFFAAALVLLAHANFQLLQLNIPWHNDWAIMRQGLTSVLFFFVLSGFLLANIGIGEYNRNGSVNLRKFYLRRVLRIWPLYYCTVLLGFLAGLVLMPLFYPSKANQLPMPVSLICTLFFIPNYLTANHLTGIGAITGLWSIGVEELFYVFFPLLFLLYKRIKNFAALFSTALLLYLGLYLCLRFTRSFLPREVIRFLSTYFFQYMLTGCVAAAVWAQCRTRPVALAVLNGAAALMGVAALLLLLAGPVRQSWAIGMLYAVIFAVLILFIAQLPNRLFEKNPLVYLGKISYGIYLLHPFASYILRALYTRSAFFSGAVRQWPSIYFIVLLSLTIGLAHLSYRWLERPFLQRKAQLEPAQ